MQQVQSDIENRSRDLVFEVAPHLQPRGLKSQSKDRIGRFTKLSDYNFFGFVCHLDEFVPKCNQRLEHQPVDV